MRPLLALLFFPAAAIAQEAALPVTVPLLVSPPPLADGFGSPDTTSMSAALFRAGEAWKSGDPKLVVAAFEKESSIFRGPLQGEAERQFLQEWILALVFTDPAKADAKLAEWEIRDPLPDYASWAGKRLTLKTRILIAQGRATDAELLVSAAYKMLNDTRALWTEEMKLARKAKRPKPHSVTDFADLEKNADAVKLASFLIDTARLGDKAFARYATVETSPFANRSSSITSLSIDSPTFCSSSGLRQDDWAVLEEVFDRKTKKARLMPLAQSRPQVLKPFLEDAWEWGTTFHSFEREMVRVSMLVRCANGAPTAANDRTAHAFLFDKFKPYTHDLPDGFAFDKFRNSVSDLAREGQWTWLVNLAAYPDAIVRGLQWSAQQELAKKLASETPRDENAVDMLRFLQLRPVSAGDVRSAGKALPDYVALVEELRKKGKLPAREMAALDLRLADLHEITGNALEAARLYDAIMTRPDDALPAKSPEAIKARLRRAAIAEAAGDQKKADAIMAQLGLSPEQCSLYQARPAITKFSMPNFPSDALRNEMHGYVSFEFDMDKAGKPKNFRVLASAPPLIFDQRTLSSFAQAEFAPVTRGGSALACEAARTNFVWKIEE